MKRTYLITAAVVCVCIAITVFTRAAADNAVNNPPDESSPSLSARPSASEEAEEVYILKELDGKIAVYQKGIINPVKITDTYLCNLPEYDIERIKVGVEVHGKTALRVALEDYCS